MTVEDITKELGEYVKSNAKVVPAMTYTDEVILNKFCKTITKVKGKYPSWHSIMTNVVQGYKNVWQSLGEAQLKSKKLEAFRQKVNFEIDPDDVQHTYLAGDYYDEEKDRVNMPISQYIIEKELKPKVIDDINWLSIMAVRDDANADGQFGKSLNGIKQVVANAVANTDHPAFKIPLSALTDSNIVERTTDFETKLPEKIAPKVKVIFVSHANKQRYIRNYVETYGQNQFQKDSTKTFFGREIVGLPFLDDDTIFGTVDNNLVKLIDKIDNPPKINMIQVQDYIIKLFMEFWLGYEVMVNELLFVSNYSDVTYGLGDTDKNQLYFGIDGVTAP
ncbi:hypothetical protein [Mesonia aestuariivivens]|uniref:Uncharacterized protein n=1 Tax=Mesonia aestuariivivens TaxID=2796128 RepID=A0ABS6W365_9FLAO|nr:hypothetical protein [Mesonia aestuariivivens]MBW2962301.1 hypothetical protein [Mesonia aestuariivivens]